MKKLIIILVIILALLATFFLIYKNNIEEAGPIVSDEEAQFIPEKKEELIKDKKFGALSFQYDVNNKFIVDEETFLHVKIPIQSRIGNEKPEGYLIENTPVLFYIYKNSNPQKLSIERWFEQNNPEEERQSAYSAVSQEKIFIDKYPAYQVQYYAHPQLTGGYYDLVSIYIPYGVDIYEINYYTKPTLPEDGSIISQNDLENLQKYTEKVQKIIESIQFD